MRIGTGYRVFLAWSPITQSLCQWAFSLPAIWFQRPSGFESCIQQRKTTCLLSIRKSLTCARASQSTTTRMMTWLWSILTVLIWLSMRTVSSKLLLKRRPTAPCPGRFFYRKSNSMEISFGSHLDSNTVVAIKILYTTRQLRCRGMCKNLLRSDGHQRKYSKAKFPWNLDCTHKIINKTCPSRPMEHCGDLVSFELDRNRRQPGTGIYWFQKWLMFDVLKSHHFLLEIQIATILLAEYHPSLSVTCNPKIDMYPFIVT